MPIYFRRYILFVFILTSIYGYSQINIDSLKDELNKLPNDTHSVNIAYKWGAYFKKINLDASLACFNIAYFRSKELGYENYISRDACALGSVYATASDFGSAAKYLFEALKLAEDINNKELVMKITLTIGNMYAYNHQFKLALGMYSKALKLAEESDNEFERSTILNNMGGLIYRESNMDKTKIHSAIPYFLRGLKIVENLNDESELVVKYNNLGLMYCDVAMPDSALYYLDKAKKIINKNTNSDDLLTYYSYLGRVYTDLSEFDKAEKCYLASIEECKKLNNVEWTYEAYLSLANLYQSAKEYEKSIEYFKRYSELKDSVVNVSNFAEASDIKNKFEREKKEVELNQLKAEQSKNRIFNIALILVSVLVVISGIMMYSRFKIKSVSESKLKIQNEIISQKNKDITDSINYARKIQQSILPSERYIDREVKRLNDKT